MENLFKHQTNAELIPIIQKQGEQLVDARQLHEFMKVKSNFNDWFKP